MRQIRIETATHTSPALCFRPVTSDCAGVLRRQFEQTCSQSCDYTAGGIIIWTPLFNYSYAIHQNTLFIKGLNQDGSGNTAFLYPAGDMPPQRKIELIRSYCRIENINPVLTAVPQDRLSEIEHACHCRTTELSDMADYIYNAESLATLTGKAYNKKRNHVNRFMAENPAFSLEDISVANLEELRLFLEGLGIESEKADMQMAEFEWQRCAYVLDRYGTLDFEGAILRDNAGRIVAFTIGEVYGNTLVLHIEKCEHLTAGAGETINKLFAERILKRHPAVRWINREDDAGDEGLRKAKMSYHPAFLLKKYNVEIL